MNIQEFVDLDKRITVAEEQAADSIRESIRDRWEFGRLMLAERKGKKLPTGMLDELVEATGKSRAELQFRMQFAEQYETEDQLSTAIGNYGSWTQVKKSLPKPKPQPDVPKPKPPKPAPKADRPDVEEKINEFEDRGEKYSAKDVVEAVGGDISVDTVERKQKAVRAERAAPPVAWDTIPHTSQVKLEQAKRGIRRELEREFRTRLMAAQDQYRAECDANVAAYKAQLDSTARALNMMRDDERRRLQMSIDVYKAKGLITSAEYDLIRSCLHPDSRLSVSDEKLAKAFRLFNDERIKTLLVKEK